MRSSSSAKREDAKLLAGGHSLLPAMKLRIARPALLVDIGRLSDLSYVREDGDTIAIGALTRHKRRRSRRSLLRQHCPIVSSRGRPGRRSAGASSRHDRGLDRARRSGIGPAVGDPRARRGSSSLVARAVTGRSPARTSSPACSRRRSTPDEMLVEIRVPKRGPRAGRTRRWHAARRTGRRSRSPPSSTGTARSRGPSIALTNMGATSLRATAAEEALAGGASIEDAAALAADGTEPPTDHAASSEFRRHLVRVLTRRALEEARSR